MWQYPLEQWKTLPRGSIPFGARYPKTKFMGPLGGKRHIGTDILCPVGTPIYAPCDGFVTTIPKEKAIDGGNTVHFWDSVFGYLHRSLHCSEFIKGGSVRAGELIALSGNTGKSSKPHVHNDISKSGKLELNNFNNFLDPEAFYRNLADQGEIKKNMKIKLVIDESLNFEGIIPLLQYVENFWADTVKITTAPKLLKIGEVPFVEDKISRKWLAENIVPYASSFDALCLWLPPEKWKNFEDEKMVKAYTVPDKILGVQVMCLATTIGSTDKRWHDVPRENDFAGKLRHELSHALKCMTGGYANVNNSSQYVPGDDNTHYYDFVVKDLSKVKKDLDMYKFQGWAVKGKVRLFKYSTPSRRRDNFSGSYEEGRVYKSSDNRMFFTMVLAEENAGKPQLDWKVITEQEFNEKVRKGTPYTEMSVAEANLIMFIFFENKIPELKTKVIREELVDYPSPRHLFLRLLGWSPEIPIKNIL